MTTRANIKAYFLSCCCESGIALKAGHLCSADNDFMRSVPSADPLCYSLGN